MSYVFPLPSLAGASATRNGYLRFMGLYSMLMAFVVASSAFLIWQMNEEIHWILLLGMAFLAVIAWYSARNKNVDAKRSDTMNTFWAVFAVAGIVGGLAGCVALLWNPMLLSMVLWASFLVIVTSFVGVIFPRVFEESWGLMTLLGLSLILAIFLQEVGFLTLLYIMGSVVVPYSMTPVAWIWVAAFLGLMGLCWKCRMSDVAIHDNAILASGGPLLNFPELFEALGQMIDRLGRAPGSDDPYPDEED